LTTIPNGGWGFVSGSSFAAAHVTGIAALLLEIAPTLKPADIHAMLHEEMAGETLAAGEPVLNACNLLANVWHKPDCRCCGAATNRRMRREIGKRSS
jgi:subtilisin family serine protease